MRTLTVGHGNDDADDDGKYDHDGMMTTTTYATPPQFSSCSVGKK